MPADYRLLSAVQDLYDLYQRLSPAGPYRLALFHDQEGAGAGDFAALSAEAAQNLSARASGIDLRIRAVSCLLANHLAPACAPLSLELLRQVEQAWAIVYPRQRPPDYFAWLARELSAEGEPRQSSAAQLAQVTAGAYRIFGEVLAVYLDLICDARGEAAGQYLQKISALRAEILGEGQEA